MAGDRTRSMFLGARGARDVSARLRHPPKCVVSRLPSRLKHLLKDGENARECRRREAPEMTHKSLSIDGTKLIRHDLAVLPGEAARSAEGVRLARGRQGRDDEGAKVGVEFVRRDDDVRPSLPDFAPARRVQIHEEYLATPDRLHSYHRHSSSSKRVGVGASSSRSPSSARSR